MEIGVLIVKDVMVNFDFLWFVFYSEVIFVSCVVLIRWLGGMVGKLYVFVGSVGLGVNNWFFLGGYVSVGRCYVK